MQVGDIEQAIVYFLNKFSWWFFFTIFLWWCPQMDNVFKKYEKIQTSKYLRSWNLHPNSYSTFCFWASFLMISFEDRNLIFYIWVFNTTIKFILRKKNIQFKQHFATTLRPLIQTNMVLVYQSVLWFTILVHFTMLA